MDVSQPLDRPRIQDLSFQRLQSNEDVDRISNFMDILSHRDTFVPSEARVPSLVSTSDHHDALPTTAPGLTRYCSTFVTGCQSSRTGSWTVCSSGVEPQL